MNRLKNSNLQAKDIALIEELGQGKIIIPEKKGKKRVVYCENSDDERVTGPIVRISCKSTQKIRKMIQKHFMTGFQWSIAVK